MAENRKPNILLIFTDQQRFDTIAALGNPVIKTPALDSLVERGVAFTHAYTPTPVCVPARHAMLTGQPAHRTGCVDNGPMPDGWTSLMQYLAAGGYQTHGVGKMHFTFRGRPREMWGFETRDFSEEVTGAPGDDFLASLREAGYEHVHDAHGVRGEMYYIPQPSQLPARLHNTTWVVDRSIEFLKNRDQDRPFFLFTSFIKPHPPFEVPTPWNKLYRTPEMPLPKVPDDWENLLTYWNRVQNRYKYRDQGIDKNLVRTIRAYYYASISFIDYSIGRLVEFLDESGNLDDTLILFTSDHGEMLGDYNSFGKRCFLDSAARVPLIACYPPAFTPGICSSPVSLLDVLPTCLEIAGLKPEQALAGESLVHTASGDCRRSIVFGQFQEKGKGVYMAVTRRWKYIYSAPDGREWLFDLKVDPGETKNRSGNLMYSRITRQLRAALIGYLREEYYTDPLDGDTWRSYPRLEVPGDRDAGLLFQDPKWSLPSGLEGYTDHEEKVLKDDELLFHPGGGASGVSKRGDIS